MTRIVSIWTLIRFAGPTAAAFVLRGRGFTPAESERLAGVLQRDLRGEFAALSEADKRRALFICWLRNHGKLTDELTEGGDARAPQPPLALAAAG